MPLWLVYHPPNTFNTVSLKRDLAQTITNWYSSRNLPKFYVVVEFIQVAIEDTWVGGEMRTETPFIRFVVDHIARIQDDDDQARHGMMAKVEKAIWPLVGEKGFDWEIHVDETDRRLWRTNGLIPPPPNSELEKLWARENRPVQDPQRGTTNGV